jgi:hypothetical protein
MEKTDIAEVGLIMLHDKLLELEREERDELAELFGKDLAWAFEYLSDKVSGPKRQAKEPKESGNG